jgi:hypothetical protein
MYMKIFNIMHKRMKISCKIYRRKRACKLAPKRMNMTRVPYDLKKTNYVHMKIQIFLRSSIIFNMLATFWQL